MKQLLNENWIIKSSDTMYSTRANLPMDTHTALYNAKLIEDPFFGDNEQKIEFLSAKDWIFEKDFEVTAELLKHDDIYLHFDSIDTAAKIELNGKLIAQTDNMFTASDLPVKKYLKANNHLKVFIFSARAEADRLAQRLPYPVPTASSAKDEMHRNLIRKVQCHFGWDWGPFLPVCGIYGNTYLKGVNKGFIKAVYTDQKAAGKNFELTVNIDFEAVSNSDIAFTAEIADVKETFNFNVKKGLNTVKIPTLIKSPNLWWPSGLGEQNLYDLKVIAGGDSFIKRFGFRTLRVINEKDDAGISMTFEVNGKKIFCKGANWIPVHAMPAMQKDETYTDLLTSVKEANMNMLRLWGGGLYENDIFYKLCDEKGILIWHDLMFSCCPYPVTDDFLENVKKEVEYQIKRLNTHASVALWCGNNECLGSIGWYPESRKNREKHLADYKLLFDGVIADIIKEFDKTRIFWSSSPCAGPADYDTDCWKDDSRGDMHYWEVWHSDKPFNNYCTVTPRFCSEFGFQSFPSLSVVKQFAGENQLNVSSAAFESHQKCLAGNTNIIRNFLRYFNFPHGFENMLYLSQIQQAYAIQTGVEYWRSRAPICQGTLYWQLNDCWPVSSWSSIEFGGKWKALHYAAKRFFAPDTIIGYIKDGKIYVYAVSDTSVSGEAILEFLDLNGKVVERINIKCDDSEPEKEFKSKLIFQRELKYIDNLYEKILRMQWRGIDGKTAENTLFFDTFRKYNIKQPIIGIKEIEDNTFELSAQKPVFFVMLDAGAVKGHFDDNLLNLYPGEKKIVKFDGKPVGVRDIKIFDLKSSY